VGREGCLVCRGVLDQTEVDDLLSMGEQKAAHMGAYGVPMAALGNSGPSVICINGVAASLAVTEFMVWATGLRPPAGRLIYRGNRSTVHRVTDTPQGGATTVRSYEDSGRGRRLNGTSLRTAKQEGEMSKNRVASLRRQQ
jgi:hypothetical protein